MVLSSQFVPMAAHETMAQTQRINVFFGSVPGCYKHYKSRVSLNELSLSYGRQSVDQFVLVSGSPLEPMTRFCPYPFFNDNYFVVLPVGRTL
jgi:hypothetical protein